MGRAPWETAYMSARVLYWVYLHFFYREISRSSLPIKENGL